MRRQGCERVTELGAALFDFNLLLGSLAFIGIPFFIAGEVGEEGSVSIAPGLKLRPESSDDRPLYQ